MATHTTSLGFGERLVRLLLQRSHLDCCYLTTSQICALWLLEVSVKLRVKNVLYRENQGYISVSVGGL